MLESPEIQDFDITPGFGLQYVQQSWCGAYLPVPPIHIQKTCGKPIAGGMCEFTRNRNMFRHDVQYGGSLSLIFMKTCQDWSVFVVSDSSAVQFPAGGCGAKALYISTACMYVRTTIPPCKPSRRLCNHEYR